jgi:peptidyl-prolyl cis-trans isomerase SurA
MKPGEFSEPIQSSGGFQIVRLNDMRGAERTMVDQLHVRHILLRPNEILDDAAVRQKALGIRDQIARGDDFATVARAVSEDTVSASDGGDLGWLSPGDTVPEFEQVIAELPLGELSEPIKSRFGWHLVEVLERRSHDTTDELRREECARQIRASKAEEERELWVRRLRDQAFVDLRQ